MFNASTVLPAVYSVVPSITMGLEVGRYTS